MPLLGELVHCISSIFIEGPPGGETIANRAEKQSLPGRAYTLVGKVSSYLKLHTVIRIYLCCKGKEQRYIRREKEQKCHDLHLRGMG